MEKRELLISLGFSEKLLEKLENYESSVQEVVLADSNMNNLLLDQYDLTDLVIKKENSSTHDVQVRTI